MPVELPALPYLPGSLQPHLSAQTVELHHGRHHRAYKMPSTPASSAPSGRKRRWMRSSATPRLFDAAAQAWNHGFYWQCLRRAAAASRRADWASWSSASSVTRSACARSSTAPRWACSARAGCGWCSIRRAAGHPGHPQRRHTLTGESTPLLCCDVWEHAYYTEYQNDRRVTWMPSGSWSTGNCRKPAALTPVEPSPSASRAWARLYRSRFTRSRARPPRSSPCRIHQRGACIERHRHAQCWRFGWLMLQRCIHIR